MTDGEQRSGEWLLVTTFRNTIGKVCASSHDPEPMTRLDGGRQLGRAIRALTVLSEASNPRVIVEDATRAVREALIGKRPIVGAPRAHRGTRYRSVAKPIIAGDGAVYAVWVWVGLDGMFPPDLPVTAAWAWDVSANPIRAMYGPGVGDLYGRNDLVSGHYYDINEIAPAVSGSIDLFSVAEALFSPSDGTTISMAPVVERGPSGSTTLASLRSVTEMVHDPDRNLFEWRGVTWDVTSLDAPADVAPQVVAQLVAGRNVWTATAYWWPLQLVAMGSPPPTEILVDPLTHKVDLREDSRHELRRLVAQIEGADSASARLWIRTSEGDYSAYEVAAVRLRGAKVPSAAVSLRPVVR